MLEAASHVFLEQCRSLHTLELQKTVLKLKKLSTLLDTSISLGRDSLRDTGVPLIDLSGLTAPLGPGPA